MYLSEGLKGKKWQETCRRWGWKGAQQSCQQRPWATDGSWSRATSVDDQGPGEDFREEHAISVCLWESSHCLQSGRHSGEWVSRVGGGGTPAGAAWGSVNSDFTILSPSPTLSVDSQTKVLKKMFRAFGSVDEHETKAARSLLFLLLNGLPSCSPSAGVTEIKSYTD